MQQHPSYNDDDDVSSDDSSSSSTSSSEEADTMRRNSNNFNTRQSGFSAIMDDWYGDNTSVLDTSNRSAEASSSSTTPSPKIKTETIEQRQKQQQEEQEQLPSSSHAQIKKKKKLVPIKTAVPKSTKPHRVTSNSSQRCYLLRGSETQGSLVEYYTDSSVTEYLAYWTPPSGKTIPKFKFTQNWGKSEIINA